MANQISHTGIVESVSAGKEIVVIEQQSACAACDVKTHCAAAESKEKHIEAVALQPLAKGDRVELSGSSAMAWEAVALAYIIPFVILIGTAFLLSIFIDNEAVVGTVSIAALIPYFIILHFLSPRFSRRMVFYAKKQDSNLG